MANILIVDDQPHLRELFSLELTDEGHRVYSVGDAESVNCYLVHSQPDLVLLDLYLHGFEGWDVLQNIKSQYPYLPVLIVTAYDNFAQDPRLSQADGYILKNFDAIESLKQKIAELLNQRSVSHETGPPMGETGKKLTETRRLRRAI